METRRYRCTVEETRKFYEKDFSKAIYDFRVGFSIEARESTVQRREQLDLAIFNAYLNILDKPTNELHSEAIFNRPL